MSIKSTINMQTKGRPMKILFYGAGAVGLGISSFLIKAGVRPTIVARRSTVKALKDSGIKRTGLFGDYTALPVSFDAFARLNTITTKNYDYILVTVKSFDSRKAARQIAQQKNLFNSKTKIILFQNGWGNAEIFYQ
jgi:2-dehydropantoate 2-reductase